MSLTLDDFQYELPEDLIAQKPSPVREESRLMVLNRRNKDVRHSKFSDLAEWLPEGGLLAVNDTRVVPARLYGRRATGGRIETLVLEPPAGGVGPGELELTCLTRPSRRLKPGEVLDFGSGLKAEITANLGQGRRRLRFDFPAPPLEVFEELGLPPLPPYIRREAGRNGTEALDRERYQTVYAAKPGAAAAPTAGLHFSESVFESLRARGLEMVSVTLHVGYGTFAPVREEDLAAGRLHAERAVVSENAAEKINRARAEGRPVVAVGTTTVRTLEFLGREDGRVRPFDGLIDLFIRPGFEFRVIDHLITNFHLPGSTLMMLVAALAGREFILEAYRLAVAERYRFFSYGDAMVIL